MDFEKKYPLPKNTNENILVQWTRGYKEIELYFEDKLIGRSEGASKLKKGITLNTEIGNVFLKLSEQPITLDVILDGYHSPINSSHPRKQLKKSATFFWLIFSLSLIGSILEGMQYSDSGLFIIIVSINFVLLSGYLIAAIFVGQAKPWAFYLGFSLYTLTTLLFLSNLVNGNILTYGGLILRAALIYFLITNIKHAAATYRHNLLKLKNMNDLLDH